MNKNNTNDIHQIIICFNLFEKASVLLIKPRTSHTIVIIAPTAIINNQSSFVRNAYVNNGCSTHINQNIIVQTQISVVVFKQKPIIIKAKITASIHAVTLAIIAKAKNKAEINRYFIL